MMLLINCWLILLGLCQLCWETMALPKTSTTVLVFLLARSAVSVLPGSVIEWNMFSLDLNFLSDCSSGLYILAVTKCIILNLQTYLRQKQCFMNISLRYASFGFSLNYCMPLKCESLYEWQSSRWLIRSKNLGIVLMAEKTRSPKPISNSHSIVFVFIGWNI